MKFKYEVVDFKEALDIEQFQVFLIYDRKELLFKSDNLDEVYAYLESLKE